MEELEGVDHQLLRYIVGAHAKVPIEFLYLETGVITLTDTVRIRRMLYLQNILQRKDGELIKRIYMAQKKNPVKGDWVHMVKEDFEYIESSMNEDEIKEMSKGGYKKEIKEKIKQKAFQKLKETQQTHSKVCNICYYEFKTQPYMKSHILSNHEVSLLFALRSRTIRNIKRNFPVQNQQDTKCQLGCDVEETQEHILECVRVSGNKFRDTNILYNHLYGDHKEQVAVTQVFDSLLQEREQLLLEQTAHDLPVAQTGPSTWQ